MADPRPESCSICFQKAFGYNYEVVSCNACKMFFRRVKKREVKKECKLDGKCYDQKELTADRPQCRPCRYKKCILVGMRLSESTSSSSSPDREPPVPASPAPGPLSPVTTVVPYTFVTHDHVQSNLLRHLALIHNTRMTVFGSINSGGDVNFCDLVARDTKLGEYLRPDGDNWSSAQGKLKPWVSLGIILIVETCKTMDFYKELLLSDRVILLKSVAFKSHFLSVSFDSFCRKKAKMMGPGDVEMIPPVLAHIPACQKFVDNLLSTPVEPLIALNITENEYLLLNMVVLCDPLIPGLSPGGRATLAEYQRVYAGILLNHCLITDSRNGPGRFQALLAVKDHLGKMVVMTQKLVHLLRTHWNPKYAPCQLTHDSIDKSNKY